MIPVNEILKDKIKRTCENNGWCIDWDHLDESFNKIKDIEPGQTAIRFGDGELVVIEGKAPNYPGRRTHLSPWLMDKLFESAQKADFFGVTSSKSAFKKKHSHVLDKWRKKTLSILNKKEIYPQRLFDSNIFTRRLDLIPHLIKNKNTLVITSKVERLADKLKDEKFRDFFGLYPSSFSYINIGTGTLFPHKMTPEKMYEYIFQQVEEISSQERDNYEAVLIGAGAAAKPVTVDLVSHFPNAFIVDASALLGAYIGKRERNPFTKNGILSHIIKWKDHI